MVNLLSKIVLMTLILVAIDSYGGCQLDPRYKYISLSGAISQLLSHLNLLSDPSLEAISEFNGVGKDQTDKRFIGGGLFISSKSLQITGKGVVFFDKGRNQSRLIKASGRELITHEIESRGLGVQRVVASSITSLRPYLIGCEKELNSIQLELNSMRERLAKILKRKRVLFFLGKLSAKQKLPNMLVLNDGFVQELIASKVVTTYPSKLAYLPWSPRIMKKYQLGGTYIAIGLDGDSKCKKLELKKVLKNRYNLCGRALLIPGVSQLKVLDYFIAKVL